MIWLLILIQKASFSLRLLNKITRSDLTILTMWAIAAPFISVSRSKEGSKSRDRGE